VVASLVLHQIPDRYPVLAEISRVLRPDGIVMIRTVSPEAARRFIPHRFFASIAQAQADRLPSISELADLMARVGFSELAVETVVRRKHLRLNEMLETVRRDVADRYPFVDDAEVARGAALMRQDARRHDDWIDERAFTIMVAARRTAPATN
jgi:SAM-dependent methyltransferase